MPRTLVACTQATVTTGASASAPQVLEYLLAFAGTKVLDLPLLTTGASASALQVSSLWQRYYVLLHATVYMSSYLCCTSVAPLLLLCTTACYCICVLIRLVPESVRPLPRRTAGRALQQR